jgi:N-methylhydantoinase A
MQAMSVARDLVGQHVMQEHMVFQRFAATRYMGQVHTVKVSLPGSAITSQMMPDINERFHQIHEQTYTFRLESPVEVVNYNLTSFGRVKKPALRKLDGMGGSLDDACKGERRINFGELIAPEKRL